MVAVQVWPWPRTSTRPRDWSAFAVTRWDQSWPVSIGSGVADPTQDVELTLVQAIPHAFSVLLR
jgi:hypothetical protein